MDKEEFINYIISIGFKYSTYDYYYYEYKKYKIIISNHYNFYSFHNGSECFYDIDLNDLTLLQKEFKQELRRIKLKQLLR